MSFSKKIKDLKIQTFVNEKLKGSKSGEFLLFPFKKTFKPKGKVFENDTIIHYKQGNRNIILFKKYNILSNIEVPISGLNYDKISKNIEDGIYQNNILNSAEVANNRISIKIPKFLNGATAILVENGKINYIFDKDNDTLKIYQIENENKRLKNAFYDVEKKSISDYFEIDIETNNLLSNDIEIEKSYNFGKYLSVDQYSNSCSKISEISDAILLNRLIDTVDEKTQHSALKNILFDFSNKVVAATDKVSLTYHKLNKLMNISMLIPAPKNNNSSTKKFNKVTLYEDKFAIFDSKSLKVFTKKRMVENYPNFNRIIEKSKDDTKTLKCKMSISGKINKNDDVFFKKENDHFSISVRDIEVGKLYAEDGVESVELEKFAFDNKYINSFYEKDIEIRYKESNLPFVFIYNKIDTIIMPIVI
jgi:hypothetical protein